MNEPMPAAAMSEPRHSGLGIASFVMSVVFGIGTLLVFAYAGMKEVSTPGGIPEDSVLSMSIGLVMMLMWLLLFVGTVLGLVGLFEKNRRKVFPALGVAFNLGMLAVSVLLIVVGLMMP